MNTTMMLAVGGAILGVAVLVDRANATTVPAGSAAAPAGTKPGPNAQQQAIGSLESQLGSAVQSSQAVHSIMASVNNTAEQMKQDAITAGVNALAAFTPVGTAVAGVYDVLPQPIKADIANTNVSGVSMSHPLGGPHTVASEVATALHINTDLTQNPVVKKVENIFHGWHW